jgi:tetratricopeptide (TPR) repeat protein
MLKDLFKKKARKSDVPLACDLEHFLVDAIEAFESHNYDEAIRRFRLLIEAHPDHPIAHLMLGRSLVELKRYQPAIEEFYKHLKVTPNSVEAMICLGLAYYECNEFALAQSRFEEAMKLRDSSIARENLIITKISAGRLDDALNDLIALNKENPDDKNTIELLILTLGRMGKWEAAKQYIYHNLGGTQAATGT